MAPKKPLSHRESEVLSYLLKGWRAAEIADHLGLSRRTIEFHKANILDKYGASNYAHLAKLVHERGELNARNDALMEVHSLIQGLRSQLDQIEQRVQGLMADERVITNAESVAGSVNDLRIRKSRPSGRQT